ncbi:hypothetical protein MRB53_041807 [Persea americana]|nr:hypothetical protein MRB53_041807 [Persea americana]
MSATWLSPSVDQTVGSSLNTPSTNGWIKDLRGQRDADLFPVAHPALPDQRLMLPSERPRRWNRLYELKPPNRPERGRTLGLASTAIGCRVCHVQCHFSGLNLSNSPPIATMQYFGNANYVVDAGIAPRQLCCQASPDPTIVLYGSWT